MTDTKDDSISKYDIGYGKTPVHTRFQPGSSGNPKGKVRGQKALKSELLEELSARVPVMEDGKRRMLSKQTIIVKRMVSDAAKGDAKARDQLLRLIDQVEKSQPPAPSADPIGSVRDAEVLARFRSELINSIQGE